LIAYGLGPGLKAYAYFLFLFARFDLMGSSPMNRAIIDITTATYFLCQIQCSVLAREGLDEDRAMKGGRKGRENHSVI